MSSRATGVKKGIFGAHKALLCGNGRDVVATYDGKMVGTSGVEPETFCTPSKRATRLRYVPTREKVIKFTAFGPVLSTGKEGFAQKSFDRHRLRTSASDRHRV